MNDYNSATNMAELFATLTSLSQNSVQVWDDALLEFYNKWHNDYLVSWLLFVELLLFVEQSYRATEVEIILLHVRLYMAIF
jgi:hypothetical protein